jgi:hypothetical protein
MIVSPPQRPNEGSPSEPPDDETDHGRVPDVADRRQCAENADYVK